MAESPVLYVYYRPDNDDSYPGVPGRHITEADWARLSPSQRRTVEHATTQDGYSRRKVWVHIDLVDETEQQRAEREAAEQAARDAFNRAQRNVKGWEYDTIATGLPDTIAGIVSTDPAITTAVTAAVGAKIPGDPYQALDIWPEFNANGGTGSWNALTYTDYIAGLDASLSGQISSGTVVKADLGASSGTERIYSYTAGDGPVPVLIVAGQHGQETLGMWASMRWFQAFATSNDPAMRQMRNAFRVTYLPAMNPSGYRASRTNANGVDTNRNYDVLWERYADGDTTPKGSAPLDQPENQRIKALFDATPFRHTIDCHNYNAAGDTVQIGLPGHYLLGPRQFGVDTAEQWQAIYGQGASWSQISGSSTAPNFTNYANYRMRHQAGRSDSTALTLEASANLFGSTTNTVSRAGVRAYAGLIQTQLLRIMENGFRPTASPYSYGFHYFRLQQQSAIPIADGGTLINSTTEAFVRFMHRTPDGFEIFPSSDAALRTFDVPLIAGPAKIFVEASGALRTMGELDGRFSVRAYIDGTNTADAIQTVTVPMAAGTTAPFAMNTSRHYDAVSKATVPNFGISIRKINGGDAELLTLNVLVTVMPHSEGHYIPRHGTA